MEELAKAVDRVLSLLPLDGKKLYISLAVKGALPLLALIPGLNFVAASALLGYVVDAFVLVGAAHKAVKAVVKK